MELLYSVSAALIFIVIDTAKLCQPRDTISTQSKKLVNIVQLKVSIKSLKDKVAFYKDYERSLKFELAVVTTERTNLGTFLGTTPAKVVDLREKLAARNIVVRSVFDNSCAMFRSSHRELGKHFCAGPSWSVSSVKPERNSVVHQVQ